MKQLQMKLNGVLSAVLLPAGLYAAEQTDSRPNIGWNRGTVLEENGRSFAAET